MRELNSIEMSQVAGGAGNLGELLTNIIANIVVNIATNITNSVNNAGTPLTFNWEWKYSGLWPFSS